jgi:hypothetical protein
MARPREPEDVRFWRYALPEPNSGCWLWTGALNRDGYAKFSVLGEPNEEEYQRGSRWAYENFVKPIPRGFVIDHKCRVRSCVNPSHLEPVMVRTNTLRGESPPAVNKLKTECVNGHALSLDNLYINKQNGSRICRECLSIRKRDRAYALRCSRIAIISEYCKHGHLWSENTKLNSAGRRVCVSCDKENKQAYKRRMKFFLS